MSSLPTPKLADLDDPLLPRPEPATSPAPRRQPTARKRAAKPATTTPPAPAPAPAPGLADEPLVAVFARLPESLSDRLAEGVRALNTGRPRRGRVSQQDLLGALVDRYVTPEDTTALSELVDGYRQRVRR